MKTSFKGMEPFTEIISPSKRVWSKPWRKYPGSTIYRTREPVPTDPGNHREVRTSPTTIQGVANGLRRQVVNWQPSSSLRTPQGKIIGPTTAQQPETNSGKTDTGAPTHYGNGMDPTRAPTMIKASTTQSLQPN